ADAYAVANRLEPVAERQRVFLLASEIDHGRTEHRPVAGELPPAGEPQLLLVAQVFDIRRDVAVESQIAGADVGLLGPVGEIDLVAADRETLLVQPEAVGDVDQPPKLEAGAADDVGQAVAETGSFREDGRPPVQPIALPD